MKVILTEKVECLGNVGDIVNVSAGYGRNCLLPNLPTNLVLIDGSKCRDIDQSTNETFWECQTMLSRLTLTSLSLTSSKKKELE